jgi:hypothetical protein
MKITENVKELSFYVAPILLSVFVVYVICWVSLGANYTTIFHMVFIALIFITSFLIVKLLLGKCRFIIIAYVTLLFVLLCLRIVSHIVTSPNILIGPDTKYELQIINNIKGSGHLLTGTFTGEATAYKYYPATEIHILSISLFTGIESTYLLKYMGALLGILFIIFVERFFFQLFKEKSLSFASAVIVGFCPFLVGMNSYTIHQSYGLIFLALFLWSFMHTGVRWRVISVISIVGMITSHALTTYIFILICSLVLINSLVVSKRFKTSFRKVIGRGRPIFLVVVLCSSFLYLLLLTPPIMWRVFTKIYSGIMGNIFSPSKYTLSTISPTYVKPTWIIAVEIFGFVVYGILILFMVSWLFKTRKRNVAHALSFAGVGLVVFMIFLLIWVTGLEFAKEVQWRGLIYLYLFTAPFFIIAIRKISQFLYRSVDIRLPTALKHPTVLIILIIIITPTCLNSVYHGVNPTIYDQDVPLTYGDYRLPQDQWLAVASFAAPHDDLNFSFGVRLSWEYVGSYGRKHIIPLNYTDNLLEWSHNNSGKYVFLRKSITTTPDYGGYVPTVEEFNQTLKENDVIYSSNEVVILRNR